MTSIIVNGKAGSGKSTIIKELQKKLGLEIIDTGQIFRTEAKKAGMSLSDQAKYRWEHPEFDENIDDKVKKEVTTKPAIVQSRTLPYLLKNNGYEIFSVFLDASDQVRAARLGDRDDITETEALKENQERDERDRKIYKKIYNIDTNDRSVYDLVINTDDKNPDEIAETIVNKLNK